MTRAALTYTSVAGKAARSAICEAVLSHETIFMAAVNLVMVEACLYRVSGGSVFIFFKATPGFGLRVGRVLEKNCLGRAGFCCLDRGSTITSGDDDLDQKKQACHIVIFYLLPWSIAS